LKFDIRRSDPPVTQLVLGTAGHIDHGKTSLVRALTGVDCDRLPEEKARGITIDLGFAHLDLGEFHFGIIDVPGHERFVHNMVAGATGVDLALLVIACDDSVMPQTVEHLAILELLGLRAGVVALTKCDLVDEDHLALVREEVGELTHGTFLQNAPVVAVSPVTEEGLPELRDALVDVARQYQRQERGLKFRLPVDRVFTMQGHGTVVTGTVRSGQVNAGESLTLWPEGREVRVRRMQSHGADAEQVSAGQRAAINLAGVKPDEVHRGDELAAAGYLEPTRRLLVKVRVLPTEKRPVRHRRLVRLHLAASEVTARILMPVHELAPGQSGYAVILCQSPIVAEHGQRFVIRRLSPVETLGGGTVLAPAPGRVRTQRLFDAAASLDAADAADRIVAFLQFRGEDALTENTLAAQVGVEPGERLPLLNGLLKQKRILSVPDSGSVRDTAAHFIHPAHKERLKEGFLRRVDRELERRRPARFVPVAPLLNAAERWTSRAVAETLLAELMAEQRLIRQGERIGRVGELPRLTQRERGLLDRLVEACTSAGPAPPALKEFAAGAGIALKDLAPLVQVAVDTGRLVRVSDDFAFAPGALESLREGVLSYIGEHGPASATQLKDHWKVTRKHAIPCLEFFDKLGVTARAGDTRTAGPNAARMLEEVLV
jgi:selenocysteine-specific elongation factor